MDNNPFNRAKQKQEREFTDIGEIIARNYRKIPKTQKTRDDIAAEAAEKIEQLKEKQKGKRYFGF